ncbi:hypothetical protein Q7P37_005424 [Cladosporium fusiforme]
MLITGSALGSKQSVRYTTLFILERTQYPSTITKMQFVKASIAVALCAMPAAMGGVIARQDDASVKCETTEGSPTVADAESAIAAVGEMDSCTQINPGGTGCTTLKTEGTAAIGVCGDWGSASCDTIRRAGERIVNECGTDHVGGEIAEGIGGFSVIVFHSDDA